MSYEPRLETYLSRLAAALGPIAMSEKAEIITEIKGHIIETMERDGLDLSSVLVSIGEPETVANRYLLERGLRPVPAPKAPLLKWLVIGFLGTFGIAALFVIVVAWRFTPLLEVNEETGRVALLGGLIDINDASGSFKFGNQSFKISGDEHEYNGTELISKSVKELAILFANGKFEVKTSKTDSFSWSCKLVATSGVQGLGALEQNGKMMLDMSGYPAADCELWIPKDIKLSLKGANGKVRVDHPNFPVDIDVVNGKIDFQPDAAQNYRYNISVQNGKQDEFQSSAAEKAHEIKIAVVNGVIKS